MHSEDEKLSCLLKAVSKLYIDPANSESLLGRPLSDIERYMFRIGANISRNASKGTMPVVGLLFGLVSNGLLDIDTEEFCFDDFALESAKRAVWTSLKSAIQSGDLIVRDALTLVPVNGSAELEKWCSADLPILDQVSANFVVRVTDARNWLDVIGVPAPAWLATDSAAETKSPLKDDRPAWYSIGDSMYSDFRKKHPSKTKKAIATQIRNEFVKNQQSLGIKKIPSVESIIRRVTQNKP